MKRWIVFLAILFVLLMLTMVLLLMDTYEAEVVPNLTGITTTGMLAILDDYAEASPNDLHAAKTLAFEKPQYREIA